LQLSRDIHHFIDPFYLHLLQPSKYKKVLPQLPLSKNKQKLMCMQVVLVARGKMNAAAEQRHKPCKQSQLYRRGEQTFSYFRSCRYQSSLAFKPD
jgi:hypothetical protein